MMPSRPSTCDPPIAASCKPVLDWLQFDSGQRGRCWSSS
jgi:hypothetical protein